MNHFGDEHPPGGDARSYLPTEIEYPNLPEEHARGYPPAADARAYLPTEIERPYPSPDGGSAYQPTHAGTGGPAPPYSGGPTGPHAPGQAGPDGLSRYGPGVPVTPAAGAPHAAERIWRGGRADQPSRRLSRGQGRWRGRAGT